MSKGHSFKLISVIALTLLVAVPAMANRRPVLFSVLSDGVGRSTLPNDVTAFSPDGAHVFLSSGSPGDHPDGTNSAALFSNSLGLNVDEEIDALSWGMDLVETPWDIQEGAPIEFYFSTDRTAQGVPGLWQPDLSSEFPRSPGDIYFAWPIFWPYGGNHLGVPEVILGLNEYEPVDDLDAMTFVEQGQMEPIMPVYFSVSRQTCGLPGTATLWQCTTPAPPEQAADVFISFGDGMNILFADESMLGLNGYFDNIDAMVLYDWGPEGVPDLELEPGYDRIYFSVDYQTHGLPGTAVHTEANTGNIQGDIFYSDFTGNNWKVLDASQLGLNEPTPPLEFVDDEDNLNALETAPWNDFDGDSIPDIVDNCPVDPNSDQADTNLDGVGDVCDPTGVQMGEEEAAGLKFGLGPAEPNPFRPNTMLSFTLEETGRVSLVIYNVTGQVVTSVVDGTYSAGTHQVSWDGRDNTGNETAAGIYFARVLSGESAATRKLIRLQ